MVGFRVRAPTARWCESRLDEGRKYLARDQTAEADPVVAVVEQSAEDARDIVPNNRDRHSNGTAPCVSRLDAVAGARAPMLTVAQLDIRRRHARRLHGELGHRSE